MLYLTIFWPFLRKHKGRLVLAFIGMVGAGFFGTYTIMLAKPALDVLFGNVKFEERIAQYDERVLGHIEKLDSLRQASEWENRVQYRAKAMYYPIEHGLYRRLAGSSFFVAGEWSSPNLLCEEFRRPQNPLGVYIWENLSTTTLAMLDESAQSSATSPALLENLTNDLNRVISNGQMYAPERFQGVGFNQKTLYKIIDPLIENWERKKRTESADTTATLTLYPGLRADPKTAFALIPTYRPGHQVRINRILLEAAYPKALRTERTTSLYLYAHLHKTKMLRFIAGVIVLFALISAGFEYLLKYNSAYSLYRAVIDLKSEIFRHIMSQDMRFFTERSVGFLMSRVTNDVNSLRTVFEVVIRNGLEQSIRMVFMFSMLMIISRRMTAIVFLMILPLFGILAYFAYLIKRVTRKQKSKQDVLSAAMNESLAGVRLIKALATEDIECTRFNMHNDKLFYYDMKQRVAKFAASPIMNVLGSVSIGFILVWGGWATLHEGIMEPSEFLIYIVTLGLFYTPLKRLSRFNVNWQQGRVSAERIAEILALRPTITDPPPDVQPVSLGRIEKGLEVRNVVFAYEDKTVLNNVSVEFPRCTTTAIVGRSGSGKTTLANLLLRLYDPNQGAIFLDGHDLRMFRTRDLRSHFGIVTQETILFDGSVASNIAYGSAENREAVIAAAKAANAHDFIMVLDGAKGYDTTVGPAGSNLSGGQRQRIAIARAFYRNPDILLLDEATSALDNESEAAVKEAIEALMRDRTVIIIAHRLSTIMHADKIIVLHDGQLVEQGRHEELLALGGHYATLYKLGEFSENTEDLAANN